MVYCAFREDEYVCIPRRPATEATLRAVADSLHILGDGVWLTYVPPEKTEPTPPLAFEPWARVNAAVAGEEARAAARNNWGGISESLIVGRRSTAWFLGTGSPERPPVERVKLPFEVDFHAVAYELVDGFLVGDRGTIVHLGIEGFKPPQICVL